MSSRSCYAWWQTQHTARACWVRLSRPCACWVARSQAKGCQTARSTATIHSHCICALNPTQLCRRPPCMLFSYSLRLIPACRHHRAQLEHPFPSSFFTYPPSCPACPSCFSAHPAGITELNWDTIAKHLGRGKRSVQRKYDNLKGSLVHGPPGGLRVACLVPGLLRLLDVEAGRGRVVQQLLLLLLVAWGLLRCSCLCGQCC